MSFIYKKKGVEIMRNKALSSFSLLQICQKKIRKIIFLRASVLLVGATDLPTQNGNAISMWVNLWVNYDRMN